MKLDATVYHALHKALAHFGSQRKLAAKAGITHSMLSEYLTRESNDDHPTVTYRTWKKLYPVLAPYLPDTAEYWPDDVAVMKEAQATAVSAGNSLPVFGLANAADLTTGVVYGDHVPDTDFVLDRIFVPDSSAVAAFRVTGMSMEGSDIRDGDCIICAPPDNPAEIPNGTIVVVKYDDTVLCKQYHRVADTILLTSTGPDGTDFEIHASEIDWILIKVGLYRRG